MYGDRRKGERNNEDVNGNIRTRRRKDKEQEGTKGKNEGKERRTTKEVKGSRRRREIQKKEQKGTNQKEQEGMIKEKEENNVKGK